MSIRLADVNLSGIAIGMSGTIKLPTPGMINPNNQGDPGHILLFNESGSGVDIDFSDGDSSTLPAGAWTIYSVGPTVSYIKWFVSYNLPNPPVTLLKSVYFYPGEEIPKTITLGNSPIGIGGTISVASGQTFQLATPFVIFSGSTNINSGTTVNVTCTGVGGIPTGATFVWVSIYGTGSIAGAFGTLVPQGATWSVANYPQVGTAAVANHIICGVFAVPLNLTNGQITVGALNGNWLNITGQIFAYII